MAPKYFELKESKKIEVAEIGASQIHLESTAVNPDSFPV